MLSFLKSNKPKIKPVVLLVIDGFGVAPAGEGNAITTAKTPNFDKYNTLYPHGELIASGESVGLPANEAGNSEVGHLTIGAGRVINQSLPRIDTAIEDRSFFENKAFLDAAAHVKKFNSKLHLMGLISSGTVHSSNEHLFALLDFCAKQRLTKVYLHLFTDGRDAPPNDAEKVIKEVESKLEKTKVGKIATVTGRYYAMDRDGRWDRTKRAYEAIVLGKGLKANTAGEAIHASYQNGKTDEFIEPTVIIKDGLTARLGPVSTVAAQNVDDSDAVVFFNFRIDRPRQLTMAFTLMDFEHLKQFEYGYTPHEGKSQKKGKPAATFTRSKWPKNLFFVTMTEYQKKLNVSAIAYPPFAVNESLPEYISKKGLSQMHLAESEKERMVAFYFDGMKEQAYEGEDVEIVKSPSVATYDKKPEMSVFKLVKRFKKSIGKNRHHFYVLNFANPDMVAHSGNVAATITAIEAVDKAIGSLVSATLAKDGTVIITADHGNSEQLLSLPTASFFVTTSEGSVNTEHSNNPVPVLIINKSLERKAIILPRGTLSDIAPTICALLGLPKSMPMTGNNLLEATNVAPAVPVVNSGAPVSQNNTNQPNSQQTQNQNA